MNLKVESADDAASCARRVLRFPWYLVEEAISTFFVSDGSGLRSVARE